MATRGSDSRGSGGGGWGYVGGIALSALLHAGLLYLALFVLPKFLSDRDAAPPSYTVKIVDRLPAGDLGTHLPRLSRSSQRDNPGESAKEVPPAQSVGANPAPNPAEPLGPDSDKQAIALNNLASATPTITPAPSATPEPTPAPTAEPSSAASAKPTAAPTPRIMRAPKPTPAERPVETVTRSPPKARPKPSPVQLAKAEPTPSVREQLAKIRKQLLAQHLADQKRRADNDEDDDESDTGTAPDEEDKTGSGPMVGPVASAGAGFGIGEGTGSAGVLKNLDFLLYYRTVQERVRKAWNFSGGSADLTATVTFSIGADGSLTGVKVTQSSKDSAYDDSVVRAIRKAAPFPPPPAQYRDQFGGGIEALFKLGEMTS